ncbi:MAG: HAD family hydrolase [Candidatus Bathyarchaeota archaeon]
MAKAVLFDLGNTLVSYYQRHEFPGILEEAVNGCVEHLRDAGIGFREEGLWDRVKEQDHGSPDNRVYPLGLRLAAIFGLDDQVTIDGLCRVFMEPIFVRGRLYSDVKPALRALRAGGVKTAIVSNTPWGSSAGLWRLELERLGLARLVDEAVFCGDVGWRKPDPRVFQYALSRIGVEAGDCLFVGDDPRWDVVGAVGVGMRAVLVDRTGEDPDALHGLGGLLGLL